MDFGYVALLFFIDALICVVVYFLQKFGFFVGLKNNFEWLYRGFVVILFILLIVFFGS